MTEGLKKIAQNFEPSGDVALQVSDMVRTLEAWGNGLQEKGDQRTTWHSAQTLLECLRLIRS